MCPTYRRQNLVHATTSRLDLCASYRALWRGCEYSFKKWLHGGWWTWGATNAFVVSRTTDPCPPIFSPQNMLGLQKGGGTRGRRPIENAEIRLLVLISLWKIISFIFRDLCDKTWRPHLEESNMNVSFCHLSDHAVSYFLHGLIYNFAKNENGFSKEMCTETWNSYICKCNNFYFNVYYLYMYMYCIYKVQSLLFHTPWAYTASTSYHSFRYMAYRLHR